MHTLKVTLKQHTPLLHFQHEQEGATLRASEVKPKLDKYVLTKLSPEEKMQGTQEGWIKSKNGKVWLDYKMRIEAEGIQEPKNPNEIIGYKNNGVPKLKNSPMFFANMGKESKPKYYVMCEKCRLLIRTSSLTLRDKISAQIGNFFHNNNFGTRQTKGYGSFTLISSFPKTTIRSPKLYFTVKGSQDKVFEEMEWFHKAIRGGINDCFGKRLYLKSLMFSYAKYLGQQWEKKTIKVCYYPKILESQISEHPGSELLLYKDNHYERNKIYYTFRDCLGLSSLEQWKKPYNKTIKKKNDNIERLRSPITFKPVFDGQIWKVYILWEELPREYLGARFKVTSNDSGDLTLTVPPEFTINSYFEYLFKKDSNGNYKVNIPSLFLVKENTNKMNEIVRIFEELRDNYNK